jgi:hypothetical protein
METRTGSPQQHLPYYTMNETLLAQYFISMMRYYGRSDDISHVRYDEQGVLTKADYDIIGDSALHKIM